MRPLLAVALLLATPVLAAEEATTDRSQIPDQYKWKLAELYPSDEAWTQAREAFSAKIDRFARHRGRLRQGTRAIAEALAELGGLEKELARLTVYSRSRSDEDVRLARPLAMKSEGESLAVKLDAATAWFRPELLALPQKTIQAALSDARLRDWRFYLKEVLRWKPHTLPAAEEKLVSMAGELINAPETTASVLRNADLPYPTIKLEGGDTVRLDPAGFERTRRSSNRADRLKAYQAYYAAVQGFVRTSASTLLAALQGHVFDQRAHRFRSTLEAALFRNDIPAAVYHQLIRDVNANLGTLHRYLELRRRMLGLDKLDYADLMAPVVKSVDRTYTIEQAQDMVLTAVAPLGTKYQDKLRHGYESGWTDFLPSTGKREGAYSTGVYGVHPFQLLNFNGSWDDVSTRAHESGHSMHTLLSYEHQPFPTSQYAIFVAEVASTLNENLLFHQALADARSDPERLALLNEHLELLRGTLFHQVMFAEFELAIHERVEKDEALTGESLNALYLETIRRYYGHDRGACNVDAAIGAGWASVPHFYYDFYIYQYATSVVASTALAKAIRAGEAQGSTAARDRYLSMLAAGGSDHPVKLLQRAGVNMTTSAPFQVAMADMNETMDQMDAILSRSTDKP